MSFFGETFNTSARAATHCGFQTSLISRLPLCVTSRRFPPSPCSGAHVGGGKGDRREGLLLAPFTPGCRSIQAPASVSGDVSETLLYCFFSLICEASNLQIAYEYAKRKANLVLVARREHKLFGIRDNARLLGAKHVLVMAADVVKEEDCRRFIEDTVSYFGHLDHLVNTASLGHSFFFEEAADTSMFPHLMDINFWGNVYPTYVALPFLRQSHGQIVANAGAEMWLPMPRMSLYAAAKAAVINFYETLRFEVKEGVGITIATHGLIGGEMSSSRFMLEEGAEMQWKEEREVSLTGRRVEKFAKLIVSGACRGDAYVKHSSWYDILLLYRVLVPDVLGWTFRLLFATQGMRRTPHLVGAGRPLIEGSPPQRLVFSSSPSYQQKSE